MLIAAERDAEARVAEEATGRASAPACAAPRRRTLPRAPATLPKQPRIGRAHPAALGRLDDAVDERHQRADRQQRARQRRSGPGCGSRLSGTSRIAGGEGDERDGHVDEEDRGPVEVLEQQAAEERAEADADRGHAGPDADRLAALLAREDVGDDRQRRRHDQRAADAHGGADGDELRRTESTRRTARLAPPNSASPALQRALAAEAVAERAHRQQQAGEHEQVGVDDPLQRRAGGVEMLLQATGSATLRIVLSSPMITGSGPARRASSSAGRRWTGSIDTVLLAMVRSAPPWSDHRRTIS